MEDRAASLRKLIAQRERLVGAAVGSGMSAAAAEDGGADLVMALNAGSFRHQGSSSAAALLPYANANEMTWDLARRHVLTRVRRSPVVLGVCAQDPALDVDAYLARAREHGAAGVTNFPSVSFFDGAFRAALEASGLGFQREVDLLRRAREAGLATVGFCLNPADAAALAAADVDVLCLNLGIAEWRSLEAEEHQAALDRAVESLRAMLAAARAVKADVYAAVFGGPVLLPQDTAQVYERTGVDGYIGGSAVERLPAASVITQTVRDFRHVARSGPRPDRLGTLVGSGPAMQKVFDVIRSVAPTDATVLIVGESGTGKELAAREIHRLSHLHAKPLVSWNCGATSESLAMSELFGHEKGAFTGALRAHVGKFELADGGTLFMDEVADLPPSVQASLLRVLQEREIVRVGGEKSVSVQVRLIAATNREFRELIPQNRFRLDLYHRLSTVVLRMPPLRERPEDLPYLIWELLQEFAQRHGSPVPRLPDPVMNVLARHSWPGNVRELRNLVERLILLGRGRVLTKPFFDEIFAAHTSLGESLPGPGLLPLAARRGKLAEVLARNGGNKTAAARELGVTRKTVHKWLRESP
jgi:two-component system response regulator HydG